MDKILGIFAAALVLVIGLPLVLYDKLTGGKAQAAIDKIGKDTAERIRR